MSATGPTNARAADVPSRWDFGHAVASIALVQNYPSGQDVFPPDFSLKTVVVDTRSARLDVNYLIYRKKYKRRRCFTQLLIDL